MNKILTCTDGSIYAPSIYDHTAWVASRSPDAAVHVLHMLNAHREKAEIVDLSGNLGMDTGNELLEELVTFEERKNSLAREQGKSILTEAHRHLKEVGVNKVTVEQQHGELVEALVRMEVSADLVVIGKRGESADSAKLHLGSNMEQVVRASIRPVLVASQKFEPIDRFLIAYDGGPSSEKAIQFAIDYPLLQGLKCHILRTGRIDEKADHELQEAAAKLRAAQYDVTSQVIAGDSEQVISETVKREGIQLLVMGAYGHSLIRQLMVGSTTTAMVRTCQIPILMFH